MYVHVHVHVHVHMYVTLYTDICIYVHMDVYMYMCFHLRTVYVLVHMYVCRYGGEALVGGAVIQSSKEPPPLPSARHAETTPHAGLWTASGLSEL